MQPAADLSIKVFFVSDCNQMINMQLTVDAARLVKIIEVFLLGADRMLMTRTEVFMRCVKICSDKIEAEIISAKLASAGINSLIVADDDGGLIPSMDLTVGVAVMVQEDIADEAESIINDTIVAEAV